MKNIASTIGFVILTATFALGANFKVEWIKRENVAQYKGADWNNLIKKVNNVSLEEAKAIAEADADITYFFLMRSNMMLEGQRGKNGYSAKGTFHAKDAVFFSGKPWYGSAPMADAYEKKMVEIEMMDIVLLEESDKENTPTAFEIAEEGTKLIDTETLEKMIIETAPTTVVLETEIFKRDAVVVFPNPSRGIFTAQFADGEAFCVQIFSSTGMKLFETCKIFRDQMEIDLSRYGKGTYILMFQNGDMEIAKRVVVY